MPKKQSPKGKAINRLQRYPGKKRTGKILLIVVEGEKTEYNYFRALIKDLNLTATKVEIVRGSGGDPSVLVSKAYDLIKKNKKDHKTKRKPKYDMAYCVFDKDGKEEKFREACQRVEEIQNCKAIISIPCFELWFLLHYCYTTSPFQSCSELIERLESEKIKAGTLKKRDSYDKNDPNLYEVLKPKTYDAIANSKRLAEQNDGCGNPSTNVHELVEKLLQT
ncbi:MAG: RloB family protein [Calothrix sp. MO_167.B12]|nr:RloB family protein [Calothrix sp. MO_167.B12]